MSNESWVVMGLVAGLWFVREVLPILMKVRRNGLASIRPPKPDTGAADASGAFDAFAKRDDLEAIKSDVGAGLKRLEGKLDAHADRTDQKLEKLTLAVGRLQGKVGS